MEHGGKVTARQCARPFAHGLAAADQLHLRVVRERLGQFVEALTASRDVDPGSLAERVDAHRRALLFAAPARPVQKDGCVRLDGVAAVGRIGDGTQLERPLTVGDDMEELLRLRVREGEQRREGLVGPSGELALDVGPARRLQDQQVAQDDARLRASLAVVRLERADEVDAVTRLDGAHQQLVLAAGELVGPEPALQLGVDALLAERLEPVERHLLALVHALCRDELRDLLRLGDRAGDDAAADDLDRLQQVSVGHLGARRADRDRSCGHVDGHELLARLHAALVIGHVEDRQQRSENGERDCDPDISKPVTHRRFLSFSTRLFD